MINWLVQTNIVKEEVPFSIEEATTKLGLGFCGLKIIPFTDSVEFGFPPGFTMPEGKVIPYGSTSLIKMFANSSYDKRGFFFNEANLRTSKWTKELGMRMLNHDAVIMPLSEAMKLESKEMFFMKPDNDLKDFCGSIVTGEGIKKFYDEVSAGGFTFDPSIQVVLCPVKNTGWEFRCFMIGDRVIAKSSYKLKNMLRQDKRVSDDVVAFAQETASIWAPDKAFVLDVVETDDGLKVVEFNCLNASGFYSCNVEKIVDEVSRLVDTI